MIALAARKDELERHPARGLSCEGLAGIRLAGPYKNGTPAAEVEAGRGSDGKWYARWGWSIPTQGSFSPIVHSQPHETEQEAIAYGLGKVRAQNDKALTGPQRATGTCLTWALRIDAWLAEQNAPKQLELL